MPKSEGLPLGRAATPGVPLLRLLLLLLVPFLLLLLRPWLPQFLGAPALPIPASHTIPGGRKNKNHTKPAKEKSNPLEPEVGAPPPSLKKKRSRLAGAANVTIETSPETLSAEAPPPLEPPGLAAQRGPPRGSRRGGGGGPPPGSPGANLEKAQSLAPSRRTPVSPRRPPRDLDSPRAPGAAAAQKCGRTDGQMDGGGGSRNRGSRRAAEALQRPRYVTMRPGLRRLSPPGPSTGARQREEGSPGAAGSELALRDAERRARRTAGRGRGLHGPGRRALPPPPRARRPPPGPRARLGLTDGDPPPPSPRRPTRGGPQPRPRRLLVREPALFFSTFGSHTSVSLLLNWLSPISSPPTFYPLSPPPPTPAGRPLPPTPGR